jgi:hypothetical protein
MREPKRDKHTVFCSFFCEKVIAQIPPLMYNECNSTGLNTKQLSKIIIYFVEEDGADHCPGFASRSGKGNECGGNM